MMVLQPVIRCQQDINNSQDIISEYSLVTQYFLNDYFSPDLAQRKACKSLRKYLCFILLVAFFH